MKNMTTRERVQTKLNNMASILLDDIIVPGEDSQQGADTIQASYYDHYGNKFTFSLGLTVTPKEESGSIDDSVLTTDQKLEMILEKISILESDINSLKEYHTTPAPQTEQEPTEEGAENGEGN